MLPAPSIDDLADRVYQRSGPSGPDPGRGPYVLFLGEGLARAAGAPTRDEIAREALRAFGFESAETSSWPASAVLDKFAAHTSSLSRSQFVRMLRSLYARVPVPSFYQDLAPLVRAGYFPLIVTTNFDTLLEQALAQAGLRASDLRVTTFGAQRISSGDGSGRSPVTHVVKLHGDLAQDTAHVTPDQIEGALRSSSQWIKADLRGDMIMIGHLPSEDPVDRWLVHGSHRELWWIGDDDPPDEAKSRIASWARDLQWIIGDLGRPSVFLGQLALRLRSRDAQWTAPPGLESRAAPGPPAAPMLDGAPEDLAATLGREILRTQSVLYNLDQESGGGDRPPQVEAQIRYQKKQIVRLEERVRALPEVREEVLGLVGSIAERVRRAPEPETQSTFGPLASFLGAQFDTLKRELAKPAPNQILVSASLGATLTVADRLLTDYGPDIVSPDEIRRLAALVPTAAGKVVL